MSARKLPNKDFSWTPKLAYAVGLIVTDGNLSSDRRHIAMRSSEKELLKTYKNCLNIPHIKVGTSHSNGYTDNPSFRVEHGDVQLYRWLEKIGLTSNKTHTIGAIKIPDNVFPDFLRGHLDGDGSITVYTDRWNTFKNQKYVYERLWVRFLSASKSHMVWLQKRIMETMGVMGHLNMRKPRTNKHVPMYSLKFGKRESLVIIRSIYYSRDIPCLERKRRIADSFLRKNI
jgi:hypothetical protein